MRSIRGYLLSRLVAGTALALALAGIALYLAVSRALDAQFDRNLAERVQGFASILFQTEDEVDFEFSEQLMPEYDRGELPAFFELRFAAPGADAGELLEKSPSLADRELALAVEPSDVPQHWSAPLPDGRPGRYVAQRITVHHVYPEEGPERPQAAVVQVVVARGTEELVSAERRVFFIAAASCLLLVGLIAALSWLAVERGLEPARRLAAKLDALRVTHLPEHLDIGPLPAELEPVGAKTDLLVRRVRAALERERRTTADIAHELRTPLSELLTVAEVALRDGEDAQGARRALGTTRDVARRMGRSVSTLLELARREMRPAERVPVDLAELVRESLRSLRDTGRARDVTVSNELDGTDGASTVEGDPEVLRIVVGNLLDNALQYATLASTVVCRFERAESGWRFVVANHTDELELADLHALSEPFWRKDPARSDRNHSGLGLALSRALAERAGLVLCFELDAPTFRAILAERS